MARKKIDARSNDKFDLEKRKGHKSGIRKNKDIRKRDKTQKKKEKARLAQIGARNIIEELQKPETIAMLGEEPTYIHNNLIYASTGLLTAGKILESELNTKVQQAKKLISHYIGILKNKEQAFYKEAKIIPSWEIMQRFWNIFTKQNPDADFQMFFTQLMQIRDLGVVVQYINKDKRPEYVAALKTIMTDVQNTANKIMLDKLSNGNPEIYDYLLNAISKSKKPKDEHLVVRKNISSVAQKFGFLFEDLIEESINSFMAKGGSKKIIEQLKEEGLLDLSLEQLSNINIKAKKIGQEKKGAKQDGQGASDIKLTIGTAEIGISAKLSRSYDFTSTNKQKIKIGETSNASGTTLENYFLYSNNTSFGMSKEELNLIRYGLTNYKQWDKIGGSTIFINNLKYLIAWDRVVKALLGGQFKGALKDAATLLPVYIATGTELFKMADVLIKIHSLTPEAILSIVNQKYSFHKILAKKRKDLSGLYGEKNAVLAARRERIRIGMQDEPRMTYEVMKKHVKSTLGTLDYLRKCPVEVSYRIIQENIRHVY